MQNEIGDKKDYVESMWKILQNKKPDDLLTDQYF